MKELLTIHHLVKKYGDLTAVDGLDLSVQEGELFAFLGPNGAGKSTTINIYVRSCRKHPVRPQSMD